MIKYNLATSKYDMSPDLKKYIGRKIGRLDRFLPKHARKTVHGDVKLTERATKSDRFECEVVINLPNERLTAKESTLNMFAAVDIVEAKLKNQLLKYKTKSEGHKKFGSGYHRAAIKRAILRRRFKYPENQDVPADEI